MADLKLSLFGKEFKNPVIAASGIYGYGEEYEKFFPLSALGGFVSKATTLNKRTGNDGVRITEVAAGVMFSVGLQNGGADNYIKEKLPRLLESGTNVFTNVAGSDESEYLAVVEKLNETAAPLIELNISCPNVSLGGSSISASARATESVVSKVRKLTSKPFTAKLSPNVTDIAEIAKAAEAGGADGITLINSLPAMKIDIKTRRPLFRNNTAAISGEAVFPLAVKLVWQAARAVKIPVIGVGGITTGEHAVEMMMAGASAVEVGAAALKDPYAPVRIIAEINEWLDFNGVGSVGEIIGSVKPW
ncbi:MAG: dihydroorotate dehydrogenase [Clostridia bacterium]|nr:dihydroorotate dehydrogenase [Clostridia bacterium]